MSKHKVVNGQLLQMNKTYKDLKNRQKDKIAGWMYEAYKRQVNDGLSNDEAFALVMEKINEAQIWVPEYEVEQKYNSMKRRFKNRMNAESIPQHIYQMEAILDTAQQKMDALEQRLPLLPVQHSLPMEEQRHPTITDFCSRKNNSHK